VLETDRRVEVDLCATQPDRFAWTAWDGSLHLRLVAAGKPLDVVAALSQWTGRPALPPPWVFGPWVDAIRGNDRVEFVADLLRSEGAPATAIWTEDWKGAEQTPFGYHLTGEWFVDEALYPDAAVAAGALEDEGFAWLAYFSPFVLTDTVTWDDAVANGVLVRDGSGQPITFPSPNLETTGLVDLSTDAGRSWAAGKMSDALALGFDGWMADFAEWLPDDAVMADGSSGLDAHNAYPRWWAETQHLAIEGADATFFHRSGWLGSGALGPMVWAGDQRTSFDADDGLPTVVAMGLSLGASGVPWMTHDVAGYSSTGNLPSTEELWIRWASLGAWSPLYRTHHGAYDTENVQFDTSEATLAHHVAMATESMRLHPYRYGLAARAANDGIPMLLPPAMVWGGDDWGRVDAWMLGDALLVAPVVTEGATGRNVVLPPGTSWYHWTTGEPAQSGWVDAPLGSIPVFAASGTLVPTFADVPDTLREATAEGVVTLDDVDGARVVTVFGPGGRFEEADGTTYTPSGQPTGPGEGEGTFASGVITVNGLALAVEGPTIRAYTVVVVTD
jgi:alpha-glucosidase (family GH31 glycosyl hydrolase)